MISVVCAFVLAGEWVTAKGTIVERLSTPTELFVQFNGHRAMVPKQQCYELVEPQKPADKSGAQIVFSSEADGLWRNTSLLTLQEAEEIVQAQKRTKRPLK